MISAIYMLNSIELHSEFTLKFVCSWTNLIELIVHCIVLYVILNAESVLIGFNNQIKIIKAILHQTAKQIKSKASNQWFDWSAQMICLICERKFIYKWANRFQAILNFPLFANGMILVSTQSIMLA